MVDGALVGFELLSFADNSSRNSYGCGKKIRVVQYVKNGKTVSVKLERDDYFLDQRTGTTKHMPKGFTAEDLDACREHWPKIMALLRNPPPIPTAQDEKEPA
jgi:hypothetical protein